VGDRGLLQGGLGQRVGDTGGGLEGRAFGQVHHHLELALVVERQHLDRHELERHERRGGQEEQRDATEEEPSDLARSMSGSSRGGRVA